jgi:TPR repeat protein
VEKDNEKAFSNFKKASELNQSEAKYLLGLCYYNGLGIEKNEELGIKWIEKASQDNIPKAHFFLSNFFLKGKDEHKAVFHLKEAAKRNHLKAQYNLAECYLNGEGVKKDLKKACYFFQKAADSGDSNSQFNIAKCYFSGIGVSRDYEKAVHYFKKAAESGDSDSQLSLSECYKKGFGVEIDLEKSKYYLIKSQTFSF